VHVWLKYQNAEMAIAGMDIGGWTVENGPEPYDGCLTRGSERLCRANYDRVYNDGTAGSGAAATGPAIASVTPTRTTVNNWLAYTLTGYPANTTVQITWRRLSGSTIAIDTGQTDDSGRATGRFRVPATPGGPNQEITFTAGSASDSVLFEVAPRIKVLTNPGVRGQEVNISLRGYAKQEPVRIRWRKPDGSWAELARITTSNTGSANVDVTVPDWAPDGVNSVRGDGTVFRQQTNAVFIQGGTFQPASENAQGTATEAIPTVTATPVTIDRSALPTDAPLPIVAVIEDATGQPVTVVTDANPATAWQADPAPGTATLTVDLGQPMTLSAIAWLEMQAECGIIDRVESSLDGANWSVISTTGPVAPGEPGVWQVLPASGDARFMRWAVSASPGESGLGCLAEVAVWGTPVPAPEPTEPPIATEPAAPVETITPEPAPTETPAEPVTEPSETATELPAETTVPPEASDQSGEP
jgi:hypothetical protein